MLAGCGASPMSTPAGQEGGIEASAAVIRNEADAEVERDINGMGSVPTITVSPTAVPANGDLATTSR